MKLFLIRVLEFLNLRVKAVLKMKVELKPGRTVECVSSMEYAAHGSIFIHYTNGDHTHTHYSKKEMETFLSDMKVLQSLLSKAR